MKRRFPKSPLVLLDVDEQFRRKQFLENFRNIPMFFVLIG